MAQDTIRKEVTGQQIIDAVKAVAQEPYVERDYVDGENVFVVGQQSGYPYEHLIVTADGSCNINPAKVYEAVTVMEHSWGGMVFAIGYGRDDVINAVKDFAQKLRQQL
jgi:hypothetical protein